MNTKALTILILSLFTCLPIMADDSYQPNGRHEFLYGVKLSASSTASTPIRLMHGDTRLKEYRIDSQVGTSLTFQGGYGFGRLSLMTGIGFDYSRSTIYVDFNSWEGSGLSPKEGCLSVEMKDLMVPLRLEYICIDQQPYSMSVFAGPKLRVIPGSNFSSSLNTFPYDNLKEIPTDYLVDGSFGIGVKTGRTFFEVELEQSFNNISKGIFNAMDNPTDIRIDRRLAIMTFSLGILL